MVSRSGGWAASLVFLGALAPALAQAADAKALYETRCATCHGVKGDGNGPAAYLLYPAPRDFTKGTFRLRSTSSGSLPTDEDLLRTVTNGIPGTAMPPSGDLAEADRRALVAHVKGFTPRFKEEKPGPAIQVGQPPAASPQRIAAGKRLYEAQGCFQCHGPTGRGDGPSSATLKDEDGRAIRPFDFTRKGRMKGGSTLADVYRTFTTGLDGTPMPSFEETLKEDERWNLAHYIVSLGHGEEPPPAVASKLLVAEAAQLPTSPDAPAWADVKGGTLLLRSLWMRKEGGDALSVKAVTDGKAIALRLEWEDATADLGAVRPQDFRDSAAVQFPLVEGKPFFGMGEKAAPVNLWHWRSDWQVGAAKYADVDTQYPQMQVAMYPMEGKAGELFDTGAGAKNPMSRKLRTSPVEDLNATALGTLTSQAPENQDANGEGKWVSGRWAVVMRRALATRSKADVQLAGKKQLPVAFAVWDGSAGDRNGQKRVTYWVDLELPEAVAKLPPPVLEDAPPAEVITPQRGSCQSAPGLLGPAALAALGALGLRRRRRA